MSSEAPNSDPQVLDAQQDLESLRNEALRAINIGLFVLANLWVAYVTFVVPDSPFATRMGPAGLFLACGITLGLSKTCPVWARRLLPLELLLLVLGYLSVQPDTLAVFLVVPILVLASVIVDRRWLLVVTGVTCVILVGLLWRNHWSLWQLYGMAILVNVLAAAATWLATENLYVAIQWA
ncbi:MAG: hypothetical protein JXA74_07200, partial [Anaerolineae bacterium]|nr:hypothetical protein [Anaerolineae bacterium]